MDVVRLLKDKWWIFVLILIFLFSYHIRSLNIIPDRVLSFDPTFQYRLTRYFADWGKLPLWDELSYFVGRDLEPMPLMFYATSVVYWLIGGFGLSLLTVSSYMAAVYGALIVIPAFLLGKELSNEYGGLLAAALIGTAPQILIRTFGSSYDNDQLVVFFIFLTLYLGFKLIRKRNVKNLSLATIGFTLFILTWNYFLYTFFIVLISIFVGGGLYFLKNFRKNSFSNNIKGVFEENLGKILVMIVLFILMGIFGFVGNGVSIITMFLILLGFAQTPEQWIVNISIAELQPFNIFDLQGLMVAMGNFFTGDNMINAVIFLFFFSMIGIGIWKGFKKDLDISSFLITLLLVAIYSSFRGIRFTEFTSGMFIILISAGFGIAMEYVNKDILKKTILLGAAIFVVLIAMTIAIETGKRLGPDINPNWESAWQFFREETPELASVGTWWDPGHMIAALAERRVFADGAHCQLAYDGEPACLYTINDRIADLGKIMATNSENESVELIRKYQGSSPKVYWIASDDLIGKFQWCQYFGTGCDARFDANCPLYMQIGLESTSMDENRNIVLRKYSNIYVYEGGNIPIPIFVQGINGALFDEIIFYSEGIPQTIIIDGEQKQTIIESLKPLENQLNFRFVDDTIDLTAWVPQHRSYLVLIPEHQRNNVFTKMFFLEGQGLEHFKQVFRNEQVKIYEVI